MNLNCLCPEELVQAADHAMYKAKLTGKNKVEISTGLKDEI